jgi:hypothetical protein
MLLLLFMTADPIEDPGSNARFLQREKLPKATVARQRRFV